MDRRWEFSAAIVTVCLAKLSNFRFRGARQMNGCIGCCTGLRTGRQGLRPGSSLRSSVAVGRQMHGHSSGSLSRRSLSGTVPHSRAWASLLNEANIRSLR
jgi:hypothetical protein